MHKQKLVLWLTLATDVTHVPDQHSHIPAPWGADPDAHVQFSHQPSAAHTTLWSLCDLAGWLGTVGDRWSDCGRSVSSFQKFP